MDNFLSAKSENQWQSFKIQQWQWQHTQFQNILSLKPNHYYPSCGTQMLSHNFSWYNSEKFIWTLYTELTMTSCYISSSTWRRLFVYAIHVGAYWGFKTPATSNMEHFVTIAYASKAFKNFMASFLWMGFNCLKATESLQGGSLLFTTKIPEIPGTHLIDFGIMKGWVNLGATQWFWTWDAWIGNLVP